MRAGAFDRDVEGTLVNRLGESVLDVNGDAISIADGDIRVLTNGQLLLDGQVVAQLAIFDLPDGSDWKKTGNAHFQPAESSDVPEQIVSPNILQGFLEQSNVDTEFQMAEMLSALRVYETAQALIQMEDETIVQAIREVGRVQ
jgi:flagellar basal-body rod protein FlgG